MNDSDQTETAKKAPECWCSYGTEGGEFTRFPHPGCPEHDPENTPPAEDNSEEIDCDICKTEWNECGSCGGDGSDDYASDGRCNDCGGSGGSVPSHCCACGGSPYCNCCTKCGASCVGGCTCPIAVQMSDGTTKVV